MPVWPSEPVKDSVQISTVRMFTAWKRARGLTPARSAFIWKEFAECAIRISSTPRS
jgi:hypothetical protein